MHRQSLERRLPFGTQQHCCVDSLPEIGKMTAKTLPQVSCALPEEDRPADMQNVVNDHGFVHSFADRAQTSGCFDESIGCNDA